MFRRILCLTALGLFAPMASYAACTTTCSAGPVQLDCTPSPAQWFVGVPLTVVASCTTCCSQAGADASPNCTDAPMSLAELTVVLKSGGTPVPGSFAATATLCNGMPLAQFTPSGAALAVGSTYQLKWTSSPPIQIPEFLVVNNFQKCKVPADCPNCQDCVAGVCDGVAPFTCLSDLDCGAGTVCHASDTAACYNACVQCNVDNDCAPCQICNANSCIAAPGAVGCSTDGDCPFGKYCNVKATGQCQNTCVDSKPCTVSKDCGDCGSCVAGFCSITTGGCGKNADCDAGQTCAVLLGAVCQNACQKGCTTSADCPACNECTGGVCVDPKAPPMCMIDAACGVGYMCDVVPEATCKNSCKPKPGFCLSDTDCGLCSTCQANVCSAPSAPPCLLDGDCGAGKMCQLGGKPCQNKCVDMGSCANCGPCELCAGGKCYDPGVPPQCTQDDDCVIGYKCDIKPTAPCQNKCVPKAASCVTDADCPYCVTCLKGKCNGNPILACTEFGGCFNGEMCAVVPDNPCANHCVLDPDATPSPDITSGPADVDGGAGGDNGTPVDPDAAGELGPDPDVGVPEDLIFPDMDAFDGADGLIPAELGPDAPDGSSPELPPPSDVQPDTAETAPPGELGPDTAKPPPDVLVSDIPEDDAVETELPVVTAKAKAAASSCSASSAAPSHGAGVLLLLALAALLYRRRQARVG